MKKWEKLEKYAPQLLYVAATLNFVASTIASIAGKPAGTSLGIGSICLCLALFHTERTRKNKESK